MLSKKMTVSLTSLIIILALVFVAPSVMAQKEFKVTVSGQTSVPHAVDNQNAAAGTTIPLTIKTDQPVANPTIGTADGNLTITTFGKNGLALTSNLPTIALDSSKTNTAKMRYYNVSVPAGALIDANLPLRIVVQVPALTTNDVTVSTKDNANKSKVVNHVITVTKWVDTSGIPKVVSIQRLRPGSQTVVAAFQEERLDLSQFSTFDVRVVLTKAHTFDPANAENLVEVEHGTASNLVVGTKFGWHGGKDDQTPPVPIQGQALRPHPIEGLYNHDGVVTVAFGDTNQVYNPLAGVPEGLDRMKVPLPNSDDSMYSQYRVTITPHRKSTDFNVKIRVKEFHDGKSPVRQTYIPPGFGQSVHLPNGRDILTVPVKGAARDLTAGYKVTIPKEIRIPAGGYLVIAQNAAGSEVVVPPGSKKDAPKRTERTPVQMKYNVQEVATLPNLATQFLRGVVVDVVHQKADANGNPVKKGDLVISEVMWGEDVSLDTSSNSQYIELYNPSSGDYVTENDKDETPNVNEALTLIFYAPNEFDADRSRDGITDRIGTLDAEGAYWSPAAKGASGRSGTTATGTAAERGDFVPVVPIISMYRVMEADDTIDATMGQMASKWASSQGPKSVNFDPLAIGVRHGTPGAATEATVTPADEAAADQAQKDKDQADADKLANTGTYPKQGQGRVYISEIMFDGGGTLPQWIEISNGDRSAEFNLSGWTLTVDNAAGDADVDVSKATFTIPNGTTIDASAQNDTPSTILVVTEAGRNNLTGEMASKQVINLAVDNEIELITAGILKGKYSLLSDMAFQITLAPPVPKAEKAPAGETDAAKALRLANAKKERALRTAATDMVGNLGPDGAAAWALPTKEEGRSSIIRKHADIARGPAAPEEGMMEDNWVLASDTSFADITHIRAQSYYGAANDIGTPGFRAGGALPVELSHFRPVRDKTTGQVVITWATQSELNNAGFFIKRSQQRNGEFKVINATMVAGAGTTSEKQFYTFTDTTAQPNVVYYYQIEDVSLDGQRQTLTRGIRLKGHIGAAGKATTLWGELKTSNE